MNSWNPFPVLAIVVGCGAFGIYLRLATEAPRGRRMGNLFLGVALILLLIGGYRQGSPTDSSWSMATLQTAGFLLLGTASLAASALCVTSRRSGQAVTAFQVVLVSNAGLMAFAHAPFLAAFAILVLVGGMGILLMLIARRREKSSDRPMAGTPSEPLLACIAAATLVVAIVGSAHLVTTSEMDGRRNGPHSALPTRGTIEAVLDDVPHEPWLAPVDSRRGTLGEVLYRDHQPALYVTAVLMFVALIGASLIVRLARRPHSEPFSGQGVADADG